MSPSVCFWRWSKSVKNRSPGTEGKRGKGEVEKRDFGQRRELDERSWQLLSSRPKEKGLLSRIPQSNSQRF